MTKKVTLLTLGTLILMAASLFIYAAPRPGDTMKHARFGLNMAERCFVNHEILLQLKDQLGLTPDQVNKIQKMKTQAAEFKIKQEAEIKLKALKLSTLMREEKVDRKEMEKVIRDISNLKTELQIQRMNFLLDMKSVMTPEQLKKLEELKKQRLHRMMDRPGMKERMKERIKERVKERVKENQNR